MDTFCVLPWYSKEIYQHNSTPCCLLPKNTNIDQLKQDLIAGIKAPACKKCWNLEAAGQRSRRQFENIFLDYKLDKDIDEIRQDCINNKHQILTYQIHTSNLCNQACFSCNSGASTKWAEIERRMDIVPKKSFYANIDEMDINYKTAHRIELLGGEPLFDSRTFYVLEQLAQNNNTNCFVSLVTNGSISLTSENYNLLSKFTDLNICISIDGIGPVFEYMRWPGKWEVLVKNIPQYRAIAKSMSVSYTISSINALYYDETVAWFESENLPFNHNILTDPAWLSVYSAPEKLKQHLKEKNNFVASLLSNTVGIDIAQYADNIRRQDLAKKIQMQDYMPKVAQIVNIQ